MTNSKDRMSGYDSGHGRGRDSASGDLLQRNRHYIVSQKRNYPSCDHKRKKPYVKERKRTQCVSMYRSSIYSNTPPPPP